MTALAAAVALDGTAGEIVAQEIAAESLLHELVARQASLLAWLEADDGSVWDGDTTGTAA